MKANDDALAAYDILRRGWEQKIDAASDAVVAKLIASRNKALSQKAPKLTDLSTLLSTQLDAYKEAIRVGMAELRHVQGYVEEHEEWSRFAIAFIEGWAAHFEGADAEGRTQLLDMMQNRYASTYEYFLIRGEFPTPRSAGRCAARARPVLLSAGLRGGVKPDGRATAAGRTDEYAHGCCHASALCV